MADLIEYKCPNCGGALEFDSSTQKVTCPYCDSEFETEVLDALISSEKATDAEDQLTWSKTEDNQWNENEAAGLCVYVCNSCGGEIVGDENMGATSCPFCGNAVVISGKFSGELKPDLVIPFKFDKNAAKEGLKNHLKGKKLLPKVFAKENHIDEVKGIYVPFWLFDADVDGSVSYEGTRTHHWSDSDYDYTETSHYSIYREGGLAFHNIPVDASSKMGDDLMDSIEPFDFSEAVDFNTAYFAGYLADKFDVTIEDNIPRINRRVKTSTEQEFRSTINEYYDTIITKNSYVGVKDGSAKYALLPVWLLNTTWQGKQYQFAMNGQTGKFVGNLPMDKGLYMKYFSISFIISTIVGIGIGYIVNFFM